MPMITISGKDEINLKQNQPHKIKEKKSPSYFWYQFYHYEVYFVFWFLIKPEKLGVTPSFMHYCHAKRYSDYHGVLRNEPDISHEKHAVFEHSTLSLWSVISIV